MFRHLAERALAFLAGGLSSLFLSPGSSLSIASLASALCIAMMFLLVRRRPGKKTVRYRVMWRALFPRWLRRPSFRTDVWFLPVNLLGSSLLFGWAVISSRLIGDFVSRALTGVFGPSPAIGLSAFTGRLIVTVCMFLAYELGYWVDHYLSHRIAFLWEFHKVHHTAEVLSPLTNFRVHPVDSVVFFNILSVFLGATGGALSYLQLGHPFVIGGQNAILVAFIFSIVHLQHSHVWMAATGPLGRVILSPAHHQIHHSDDPIHFDKNFGSCLSVWDWLFGTLWMPERTRERLSFGVETRTRDHHTAMGSVVRPFVRAWKRLLPAVPIETRH
ncbi:MAG TPA: sterol desaturase family protein [Vicinamibacterales bacterium]|nr:sterol desaturase family protein [Vicinamibacterales bacterium]